MKKYAIIVAGGVGARSGDSLPKQFHILAGHPMLWWSLKAFADEDQNTELFVVMHPDYIRFWNDTFAADAPPHRVVAGGATRTDSVAAGLTAIKQMDDDDLVAIHDAARPLVSKEVIAKSWQIAGVCDGAVPVSPVTDTLRIGPRESSSVVDRNNYYLVQTPQTFPMKRLAEWYVLANQAEDAKFTDDASVAEWNGARMMLFDGDPFNFKVTWPEDFIMAEALLKG